MKHGLRVGRKYTITPIAGTSYTLGDGTRLARTVELVDGTGAPTPPFTITLDEGTEHDTDVTVSALPYTARLTAGTLKPYETASEYTITSLSRDAGSADGGATVVVTGTGFQNGDTVYFSATAAATTYVSATTLSAVTPAHSAGQVDVSVRRGPTIQTLTGVLPNGGGAFEFEPAPTVTYLEHDFEDGTLGPFYDGYPNPLKAAVEVGAWGVAKSGAQSVRATMTLSGYLDEAHAMVTQYYDAPNPHQPALETNGLYQRWYINVTAGMRAILDVGGSAKLLLNRTEGERGWLHVGMSKIGGEGMRPGVDETVSVVRDYDTQFIPSQPFFPYIIPADTWVEIQTHYLRSGGVGRARQWIDGKLWVDYTDANFGTDSTATPMKWSFGFLYCQNATGTMVMYTDLAAAKNGFIDP